MKTFTLLLVMVFIGGRMVGQNLVPNGSFEEYDTCPDYLSQVYHCMAWENWLASSDYFNVCAPCCAVSVPYNLHIIDPNFQIPHTGDAYAGLFTYWTRAYIAPYPWIRDEIAAQLTQPMQTGVKYYFTMYVALASFVNTPCASSKIGVKFTTQSFASLGNGFTSALVNNYAPIYIDSLITDSANWTKVMGSFVADSAYQYVVIGNFFDDFNTDTLIIGSFPRCYSYYLIDDVCLSTDSTTCFLSTGIESSTSSNHFSLSPNPVQNLLTINFPTPTASSTLAMYDALGRKVKSCTLPSHQKTFGLSVAELPAGVYLVAVNSGGLVFVEKVVKE